MKINTNGTNVILLFGDDAVKGFPELVRCWSRMLSVHQWDSFQFILVGSAAPDPEDLEDLDKELVNDRNTRFFSFEDKAPDSVSFHNLIVDKISTGTVWLHAVCNCGTKEAPISWVSELIRSAAAIEALTVNNIYYLLFGMNSLKPEREQLVNLVQGHPGSCFLLGDTNEKAGR